MVCSSRTESWLRVMDSLSLATSLNRSEQHWGKGEKGEGGRKGGREGGREVGVRKIKRGLTRHNKTS